MTEDELQYVSACESMIVAQDRFIAAQKQLIDKLFVIASARIDALEREAIDTMLADTYRQPSDQTKLN